MPLKITFDAGEIEDFLRVDTPAPAATQKAIENMKAAAMDEAEGYLNTDFSVVTVNADGTTTTIAQEAPPSVKDWVLNRVVEKFENRGKSPAIKPEFGGLHKYRKYPFRG